MGLDSIFQDFSKLAISNKTYQEIDMPILGVVYELVLDIHNDDISGDIVEVGTFKGYTALLIKALLNELGSEKKLYLYDTFDHMPDESDLTRGYKNSLEGKYFPKNKFVTSLDSVMDLFSTYGLLDDNVIFVKGLVGNTMKTISPSTISLLRIDVDLYSSTYDGLQYGYPKVTQGGWVILDDLAYIWNQQAVVEYFNEQLDSLTLSSPYNLDDVSFKELGKDDNNAFRCSYFKK